MYRSITVADVLRPHRKVNALAYNMLLVLGGSLLIAASAQMKLWLPFSPVPVTGQTFAVLVIGMLFGPGRGCLCVVVYLLQGVAGFGVFAAPGPGGLALLVGPTGGYLLGFAPAAFVTGFLAQRAWDRRVATTIAAMILGNLVIYAFGLIRLWFLTGTAGGLLTVGVYPFLVGDCVKILLAALVLPSGWKLLKKFEVTPIKNP